MPPMFGEDHPRYPGWRVAAASAVCTFCWAIPPFSFAVFLKPIAEEFAWSRESVSAVFGVSPLVGALCAGPAGYLIDRFGARAIIIPSLVAAGAAFALRSLIAPPLWSLVVLFAISGLAGIGASPIAFARLLTTWFDRRRGQALGIAIAGAGIGTMVHPPLAQALIDAFGWRAAHLVLGGLIIGLGVPTALRCLRPRLDPVARVRSAAAGATVRDGLTSRLFWTLAAVVLCDSIANSSLAIHLPALLSDRGITAGRGAIALSAMGGAAVLGRLTTGRLLDRWFAGHVSMVLLALSAAGVLLLAQTPSFVVGTIAAVMVGFGMGGEADVTPYLLSRYFGLRSLSTLYGVTYMATGLGWATGPALMGRAFDATGSYSSHLRLLATLLIGAAVLLVTLPRYAPPERTTIVPAAG
jgi:MFS family permease